MPKDRIIVRCGKFIKYYQKEQVKRSPKNHDCLS